MVSNDFSEDCQTRLYTNRRVDEVLLKTKEVNALQRPSKRDYEGVRRWFKVEEPIFRSEAQFIRRKEDIVTLRTGRESAGFDSFIERCLGVTDEFLQKRLKCRLIQVRTCNTT